jgi:hypothetical protein
MNSRTIVAMQWTADELRQQGGAGLPALIHDCTPRSCHGSATRHASRSLDAFPNQPLDFAGQLTHRGTKGVCEEMPPARQVVAPAEAGAQGKRLKPLDSRLRGNDGVSGAGFVSTIPSQPPSASVRRSRPVCLEY